MTTFYKSETAEIFYNNDLDAIILRYLKQVKNDEEFIEINTCLLDSFKKLNTQKFVADIRKMGVISPSAQEWVVKNLIPGMFDHLNGKMLYHAQLLDPKEIFNKVSGSNIKAKSSTSERGFKVEQFSEEKELEALLKSLP